MKRMKQIAVLLAAGLLLSGCADAGEDILAVRIDEAAERTILTANTSDSYASYYLQPSFGRISYEGTCTVFNIYGMKLYMNLRAQEIIREAYYDSTEAQSLPDGADLTLSGTYEDINGTIYSYEAGLYGTDGWYVVYLQTAYADFLAAGTLEQVSTCAGEGMAIARSLTVDTESVKEDYSQRRDITYTTSSLELFETLIPEEGSIDEILTESGTATASPESE
jgi:hypothetical protein